MAKSVGLQRISWGWFIKLVCQSFGTESTHNHNRGLHQQVNTANRGLHQWVNTANRGLHQHIIIANRGLHQHIIIANRGLWTCCVWKLSMHLYTIRPRRNSLVSHLINSLWSFGPIKSVHAMNSDFPLCSSDFPLCWTLISHSVVQWFPTLLNSDFPLC